jgi:hypothetical protein
MQLLGPSLLLAMKMLQISVAQNLYLALIGSLSFAAMQRLQRGALRVAVLLLLTLCISAPLLLITPLHMTSYLQRMAIAVTCAISSHKQLELMFGTALPGVLDSRSHWLVRTSFFAACLVFLPSHARCCHQMLLLCTGLLLQQCRASVSQRQACAS